MRQSKAGADNRNNRIFRNVCTGNASNSLLRKWAKLLSFLFLAKTNRKTESSVGNRPLGIRLHGDLHLILWTLLFGVEALQPVCAGRE